MAASIGIGAVAPARNPGSGILAVMALGAGDCCIASELWW